MQNWEYKLIEEYNEVKMAMAHWQLAEDGQKLPGKPDVVKKFQELGAVGWELVAVTTAGAPIHYYYWFKRPK